MRRVNAYGLSNLQMYSPLTDEELDSVILMYIENHGRTTETFIRGYHLEGVSIFLKPVSEAQQLSAFCFHYQPWRFCIKRGSV